MRNFAVLRCMSLEKRFVCRNGLLSPLIIVYFCFAALAGKAYTVSPMARMLPSAREKMPQVSRRPCLGAQDQMLET